MKKLNRKILVVNGVERFFIVDPETDKLSDVLRRNGLTGTKVGCGVGVCGACSVILNGELKRSCSIKISKVEDYATITTIEGIGTPNHLHPLQQAWAFVGAAQCGFCSPGFIVSAYALLEQNPSPTREEVREWFRVHKNICRCTGYKPIVDAVMLAAEVMRGEKTMDDITYHENDETDPYGTTRPRPTAVAKVCGLTDFGDDIGLHLPEGFAHLVVVLSEVPHAKINKIDIEEAEKAPGVYKVLTAKDVQGTNELAFPMFNPRKKGNGITNFPIIAGSMINKVGDVVAVVCADSVEHARAAAKLVKQDLEILPYYMTAPEAVAPGAMQLYPDLPNFHVVQPVIKGKDVNEIFESAPYVAEGSFSSQHEPHLPIESDMGQGYIDEDGTYTIQIKCQNLTETKNATAGATGLAPDQLRVISNAPGGMFGYGITSPIPAVLVTAMQVLDMPCSLSMNYAEFNHTSGKRSGTYTNGRIAVDANGKIVAAEYDCALDHGAYTGVAPMIFNNLVTVGFHGYNIPNMRGLARGLMSNQSYNTAYRGFGSPQIYTTTEALIDMAAEKAGIDPWQFRYDNAARPGDTTINQRPYKEYVYPKLLEMIKPYYDEYKAAADKAKAEGRHVGVGISLGGFLATTGAIDFSEMSIELTKDNKFLVKNTWEDVGQGGDIGSLVHTLKALEPMGVKADQIILQMNDSKACPDSGLSAASRQHYMTGNATIDGCTKLMNAMRKPDGTYRTYEEMVAEGIPTVYVGHYDQFNDGIDHAPNPNDGSGDKDATFMYGVNTCLVEVDVNTGKTQVLKYTTCADVGTIGNKLAVLGQAYGGLSHSIGFALSEDYDPLSKKSGNVVGCGVPQIDAIPDDFNVFFLETPRPKGPHGSSGCSECFQSSGHMAVINAIHNACGVRVYNLPATPDKVKAGWQKVQNGEDLTPPKYFLGSDIEDEFDEILDNPL